MKCIYNFIANILCLFWILQPASHLQAQTDISSTYTFKQVKVGGGGFVTGLVINPSVDNVVYCRTDVGGAYKYDFSTNSWIQLVTFSRMPSDFLNAPEFTGPDGTTGKGVRRTTAYHVLSIATDPNNASIFYMVTDGGLFKSTDGGNSFTWLQNFTVSVEGNQHKTEVIAGERLQINPNKSSELLFGSQYSGLYKSTDGGANWTQISAISDTGNVLWVQYDKSINGRVYAAVKWFGVYRSNDGGNTWTLIKSTRNPSLDGQAVNGLLWFLVSNDGVYKYNGSAVTKVSSQDAADLAVDPNNNQVVYVLTDGFNADGKLKRTTDGGATWTDMIRNISSSIPWKAQADFVKQYGWLSVGDITIDPRNSGRMWFAEGMGVFMATIGNTINNPQFVDISHGISEFVATDVASSHNGRFTVSCWDRVGFTFTDPDQYPLKQAGASPDRFSSGSSVATSPTNPDFVIITGSDFGRCYNCNTNVFSAYSSDGGQNWTKFGSINSNWQNNPADLVAGEAVVSANSSTNFVWLPRNSMNHNVYYTVNAGSSWSKANISGCENVNWPTLTTKKVLCADGATQGKFYLYNWLQGNVFVTTDGGSYWTNQPTGLPINCWHAQLKSAPGKAGHIWFVPGYDHRADASQQGLWYSTNSGSSFTKVANVQECWAIGFGKEAPGSSYPTIYIFGRINDNWGLYRSTDQAASWSKLVDYPLGLFDYVTCLEGDVDVFGKVYIGYAGNGWAYGVPTGASVPVTGVTVSPTSATITIGASQQLTATVIPSDATNKNVTWISSNPSVATVSSSGLVTGIAVGTATITVTTQDGNKTDSCTITVTAAPPTNDHYIYQDGLSNGWTNGGWGHTVDLNSTTQVYQGTKAMAIQFTSAWGACVFNKASSLSTAGFTAIKFWARGTTGSNVLQIVVKNGGVETGRKSGIAVANGSWNEITVNLSEVGNPSSINEIWIHDGSGSAQPLFYVDNFRLVGSGTQQYTLNITSANGTVTKNPDKTSYAPNENVTLTATPNTGYSFSGWSGDASGSANPLTITMNANKSITANFTPIPTYTLTVNSGSGDGTYTAGTVVNISADAAPAGQVFDKWVGDVANVANVNSASTTITMPSADISVTATYKVIDGGTTLYAKVNFQPATAAVPNGYIADDGSIYGTRNGFTYGWNASNTSNTRLRTNGADQRYKTLNHMMKNGTFTWEIAVPNGDYSVEVLCGDGDYTDQINSLSIEGISVTDPDGQDNFDLFTNVRTSVSDGRLTVVPIGTNTKICYIDIYSINANAQYVLTVNNGSGDGTYTAGTVVNISADAAPAGQVFDKWTGDVANVADIYSANTTLTMPASAVTLTATYKALPTYTLTVNSGSGDGTYTAGTVVNISADAAPAGQVFNKWIGDVANVANINSANTTITMPAANVTLTATYKTQSVLTISNISRPTYQVANLVTGVKYYIDRDYTILSVPSGLNNQLFIKTANNDKALGTGFSFDISSEAIIYVCYDRRSAIPSWLSTWNAEPGQIDVSDASMGYFNLYKKQYPAGTVTLGANNAGSMYIVAIVPLQAANSCGLVTNNGFENDLNGWINNGNNTISTLARTGVKALRTGTGEGGVWYQLIPVTAGNTVDFEAYAKVEGADGWCGLGITFVDANGNEMTTNKATIQVTSTEYAQYTASKVVPDGAVNVRIWTWKGGTIGYMYVDDVCLSVSTLKSLGTQAAFSSEMEDGLRIYPNPAEEFLFLENLKGEIGGSVIVTDVTGKTVYRNDNVAGNNSLHIDVSHLSKGIYLLTVKSAQKVKTVKFVVD